MRLLLLIAGLLVLAPGAGAAERPRCGKGGKTVASNGSARVYEQGSRLKVCRKADRRREVLARRFDDGYVESADYARVVLAGAHVGWVETYTDVSCKAACPPDYEPTRTWVNVHDVATGDERLARVGTVSELVLTRTGGAAWIEGDTLSALDAAGERVLDTGAVAGLEASRSRVSWLNAGELRAAALS